MALTASLALDVSKFEAGCKKAVVEMQGVERAGKTMNRDLKRLLEDISGQKIAVEAARAAEAVSRIGGASKLTEAEQKRVNATVSEAIAKYKALGQEAPAHLVKLQQETTKTASATSGLASSVARVPAQLAAVGVSIAAVSAAAAAFWAVIERGGRASSMAQSFEALAGGAEKADKRIQAIRRGTGGLVTDMEAMQAANKAMLLGLGLTDSQMGNLAQTAAVLGRAMGQDASKSLDDLITALGRSSPMILDNLGLSVKLGEAHEMYARALGKTSEELTDAEKKQAFMNAAMDAANEKVQKLGGLQLNAADRGHQLWTQIKNLADATSSWVASFGPLNWALEDTVEKMSLLEEMLKHGLIDGIDEYKRKLGGEIPAVHGDAADAIEAAQKRIAASFEPVLMGSAEMERISKRLTESVEDSADALRDFNEELARFSGKDAAKEGQQVVKMLAALGGPTKVLPSQLKAMATALEDAAQAAALAGKHDLAGQYQLLARTLTPAVQFQQRYNVTLGEYVRAGMDAAATSAAVADQMAEVTGQVIRIGPALQAAAFGWERYKSAAEQKKPDTSRTEEETQRIQKNLEKAAYAAYDFAMALRRVSQEATSTSRQLSMMQAGASIGSSWGPLGTAIGGYVGWVAGTMMGDPKFVKIMGKVGQQWGLEISEEMGKQLEQDSKKFKGRVDLAAIMNVGNIVADQGGLTLENFSNNWLLLTDAIRQYAKGALTAAQTTKVLNDNFQTFVEAGSDSAGRLSGQMLRLIGYVKATGLEIKAVTEYLQAQANAAATGINAVINASSKQFESYQKTADAIADARKEIEDLNKEAERGRGAEWTQKMADAQKRLNDGLAAQKSAAAGAGGELENLGIIALAAYNAAIEAGMTHSQALQAAGPGLTQLITAYENLGLGADNAAVQALMMQASLLKNNPELLAGLDGLAQAMLAMGNMGVLNTDTFAQMQAAGMRMYERLQAEVAKTGGSTRDALLPMQAYLQEAAEQAKRLNIPLDATTQALIAQSKELGIWKDKGKAPLEVMIDLFGEMKDAIVEMGRALRGLPPMPSLPDSGSPGEGGPDGSNGAPGGGTGPNNFAPGGGATPNSSANARSFGAPTINVRSPDVFLDGRQVAFGVAPHMMSANRMWGV